MRGVVSTRSGQCGAALLALLVMVAVLGLGASLTGQSLRAFMQREHEAELLWRGLQYRRAIASYYNVKHGPQQMYPGKLEDLMLDPRSAGKLRHLRRLYTDPMTGAEWETVRDPAERIIGVRSSSDLAPFKQIDFPKGLESLEGKSSYREWEFVFVPERKTQSPEQSQGQGSAPPPKTGGSLDNPRNPFSNPR